MKRIWIALPAAIANTVLAFVLGGSIGFSGITLVLPCIAAGVIFGLLVMKVGPKALLIPLTGFALGLLGVCIVRIAFSVGAFDSIYYLFVPAISACVVTLATSAILLLVPGLRHRLFRTATDHRNDSSQPHMK